jgi:hypothetical protein
MILLHEEKANYNSWLRLLAIIPIGSFIGALALFFNSGLEASLTLLGDGVLFTLLFYFILPRKFQIYQDRLRIALGPPFAFNIPLSTIKEARPSPGAKAYVYSGIRLATSTRYVIEIVRTRGSNYIISPQNGELFLEQLNLAIKNTGLR